MLYTYLSIYAWIAIVLSLLYTSVSGEAIAPAYMIPIILVAILPIIQRLVRYIRDHPDGESIDREYVYTYGLIATILSVLAIITLPADTLTLISLVVTVLVLIRGIDARYLFALALAYIISVPLLLATEQSGYAEYMSIQAYYALVLGTLSLLLSDRLQRVIHYYIPPLTPPLWWSEYRRELIALLLTARRYIPYVFVLLVSLVALPGSTAYISYDERLVATVTVMMGVLSLLRDDAPTRYAPYVFAGLAGASYLALFSAALIEGAIGLVLYGGTLYILHRYTSEIDACTRYISSYLSHE